MTSQITLADDRLELTVEVGPDDIPRLTQLAPAGAADGPTGGPGGRALPLADVVLAGEGRAWSGRRYCESATAPRLRYAGHVTTDGADHGRPWRQLRADLADPGNGLRAEVSYRILDGTGTVRSWVRLVNAGPAPLTVTSVTSFLLGAVGDPAELDVWWAGNDWLAEGRWTAQALRDLLPDLGPPRGSAHPRGCFGRTSLGSWSSGRYLPMGALATRSTGRSSGRSTGRTWLWQVEHQGAWHWQVGERDGAAYLAVLGPADTEHQWRVTLAPGQAFTTVPAAVAVSDAGFDGALAALTSGRRATRRPHPDHQRLPVIFNDYMNTLMGDPSTERLRPLIRAAGAVGAEYFCIDAGWYAEAGEPWWDTVGEWQPAVSRFPGGLSLVLDDIRDHGMVPGLWLEPEVVGVRSPVADRLPPAAFLARDGQRVVEHGRYHLDLRHPAAVQHLDQVVDRLVGDLGVGYLKLDYNINAGPGTDLGGGGPGTVSPGAGLLGHNRAHLAWLDAVLDRHPGLVLENCASGGMRADHALLARLQLQSTSDQQDLLRYAAIAAAAPATVPPEQGAVWAYPQPEFSDAEIAFTLGSALLGRIHLSGHLDRMSPAQQHLVAAAITVYRAIRSDLAQAVPLWPLGPPGWDDPWLALALRTPDATYLTTWRRPPGGADAARLPLPHLRGQSARAEVLYPAEGPAQVSWDPAAGEALVALPEAPAACLIRLRG
jgi:alpha-galactosidase